MAYDANAGQTVLNEDAWNIAVALTRALDNFVATPEEALAVDLDGLVWPRVLVEPRPADETLRLAFATWAGDRGRKRMDDLIRFCAAGGFQIN